MQILAQLTYNRKQEIGQGEGRNSKVFLVHEPQLGGDLVVKEIPTSSFPNSSAYFAEAQKVYAARSPHVVPIHYAALTGEGRICLVMPHYLRGSLVRRIADGPIRVREMIRVAQEICAGVSQIHAAGLVHLDVKPSNVLFDEHGHARVADFGQSVRVNALGIGIGPVRIYNSYMPPEALNQNVVVKASDVYQIGLTLYRMVNGEPYFSSQRDGKGDAELTQEIGSGAFPRRDYLPHVPHRVRRIITRALEVDPADRFQTAAEVAEELAAVGQLHDWDVIYQPSRVHWRLARTGFSTVEVTRDGSGNDLAVEVWTVNAKGERRRRGERDLWRKGMTPRQAATHLNRVFRGLP